MVNAPDELIRNFLIAYDPEIQDIVLRIREVILDCVPDANEKVNLRWRSISYKHPGVGYFCGVFPREQVVEIAFEWGMLLPDTERILTRTTSQVGYVLVRSLEDLRVEPLRAMLAAAINLPDDREARMAMVKSGARLVESDPDPRSSGAE